MAKEWYTERQEDHVPPRYYRAAGTAPPDGLDATVKKGESPRTYDER